MLVAGQQNGERSKLTGLSSNEAVGVFPFFETGGGASGALCWPCDGIEAFASVSDFGSSFGLADSLDASKLLNSLGRVAVTGGLAFGVGVIGGVGAGVDDTDSDSKDAVNPESCSDALGDDCDEFDCVFRGVVIVAFISASTGDFACDVLSVVVVVPDDSLWDCALFVVAVESTFFSLSSVAELVSVTLSCDVDVILAIETDGCSCGAIDI